MHAELFFSFFSVFKVILLNISKTYSDSQTSERHLSKETNTMHIIQMAQEQHAFTLGMPFLGKFYRNIKGLKRSAKVQGF